MSEPYVTTFTAVLPGGRREILAVDVQREPRNASWRALQRRAWLRVLAGSGYREAQVLVTESRSYERRVFPAASPIIVPPRTTDPLGRAILRASRRPS